jgi:8-hydroxy-5-deazaflavin:NADPH oxidoreductase
LSAAGHDVKVANSRGPDTIEADTLSSGARAVSTADVVVDVDVVILSIPLNRIPEVASLFTDVPAEKVVIDTSNYYPGRDSRIEAIEGGQAESLWVTQQLGRPVVKAWNASDRTRSRARANPPGVQIASPFLLPPIAKRNASSAWHSSRTLDSTHSMQARLWNRGDNSPAHRVIARTSPCGDAGRPGGSGRDAITEAARPRGGCGP